MCERAVFLSRLELAVLLMAGGVEHIQCFALPEAKDVDEKQMIGAVYDLTQKGFLQVLEEGIDLAPGSGTIVDTMKDPRMVIYLEPGDERQPQRIVYVGEQAIILENTMDEGGELRLSTKEQTGFWKWIEDAFELPVADVISADSALRSLYMNGAVITEWEMLQTCTHPGIVQGLRAWMESIRDGLGEAPYVGIRIINARSGKVERDMVIAPGLMNLWFIWCEQDMDVFSEKERHVEVVPDSIETRNAVQKLFWREIG